MQIITIDMLLSVVGVYFQTTKDLSAALFHAIYQDIALSFGGILHSNDKLTWTLILLGLILMLPRLAKARKIDFLRSIFGN